MFVYVLLPTSDFGLNFSEKMTDIEAKEPDDIGSYIAGSSCVLVAARFWS